MLLKSSHSAFPVGLLTLLVSPPSVWDRAVKGPGTSQLLIVLNKTFFIKHVGVLF